MEKNNDDAVPLKIDRSKFDIDIVDRWKCPAATGVPLITMPNIPRPLHGEGMQPRTIYSPEVWEHMRQSSIRNAHNKCEICGVDGSITRLYGHELFSYDYINTAGRFIRVVSVCKRCHDAIHSGRMLTLYKERNPYYRKEYVLRVIEECFRMVDNYNLANGSDLRVYSTFLQYLRVPSIASDVEKLISLYHIKFYEYSIPRHKRWKGWKVIIGSNTYESPYNSQGEWEEAMKVINEKDLIRNMSCDNLRSMDI